MLLLKREMDRPRGYKNPAARFHSKESSKKRWEAVRPKVGTASLWRDACDAPTPRGYINIFPIQEAPSGHNPRLATLMPAPDLRRARGGPVKGVGKFGEVMAGEKGEADYKGSLQKLQPVGHRGSQPKAILDFLAKELRRAFPTYTLGGVDLVGGDELRLRAWR